MKFLFILLILMLVFGLIALRYRKQIQTALDVWRMFRKMQEKPKAEKRIEKTANPIDTQLVKCAKCGAWIPLTKAIYFRSKTFYCSKDCMKDLVAN